jgi:hypothetical protein
MYMIALELFWHTAFNAEEECAKLGSGYQAGKMEKLIIHE